MLKDEEQRATRPDYHLVKEEACQFFLFFLREKRNMLLDKQNSISNAVTLFYNLRQPNHLLRLNTRGYFLGGTGNQAFKETMTKNNGKCQCLEETLNLVPEYRRETVEKILAIELQSLTAEVKSVTTDITCSVVFKTLRIDTHQCHGTQK